MRERVFRGSALRTFSAGSPSKSGHFTINLKEVLPAGSSSAPEKVALLAGPHDSGIGNPKAKDLNRDWRPSLVTVGGLGKPKSYPGDPTDTSVYIGVVGLTIKEILGDLLADGHDNSQSIIIWATYVRKNTSDYVRKWYGVLRVAMTTDKQGFSLT